jgi:hypothetical protein
MDPSAVLFTPGKRCRSPSTRRPLKPNLESRSRIASKLPQPEEQKPAINMRMMPTALPQASQINGAVRSSSVGGTSALSPLVIRKRPEEMKETPIQHVRMTVQPSTQSPTKAAAPAGKGPCTSPCHLRSDYPGDRPASYKSQHRQSCCPSTSGNAIRFPCPSSSGSPLRDPSCSHSGIDRSSLV